jgi:nucleoside-diphosphate-sugar epimerase
MNVLLIGASSQIGYFLLPRLLAEGHTVQALSRQPQPEGARLHWREGYLPQLTPDLSGLDALVSFGPLDVLAQWIQTTPAEGVLHVVATSSMSAQSKQVSEVSAERELAQRLCQSEAALLALCAQRGWSCTILRPTIVYGAGLDKSFTPLAQRALRSGIFLLPRGRGERQPVHADDIAQAALAVLRQPQAANGLVIPIGGGERLNASAMFARIRRSLGRWTLPLPLWHTPLRIAALLLPPLRGPVSRLRQDLIADNGLLQRHLGVSPRPFQPDPRCWQPPAGES